MFPWREGLEEELLGFSTKQPTNEFGFLAELAGEVALGETTTVVKLRQG